MNANLEHLPAPPWRTTAPVVARLFLRTAFGRRRSLWLGLLLLLPVLAALAQRLSGEEEGPAWFAASAVPMFVEFLALGLSLYLGVSALADEIEDGTIVYLLCRPVPRAAILVAKVAAVVAAVGLGLSASLLLTFLSCHLPEAPALAAAAPRLARALGVVWLEVLAYTAVFSLAGALLRKPLLLSLIFGFGWEVTASHLPGELPRLTLMFYLRSLLGLSPDAGGVWSALIPPLPPAGVATSLAVALGVSALCLGLAAATMGRREYRL